MPTPAGKLAKGDRLTHPEHPGVTWTVVKRNGNDDLYSVTLKPDHPAALRGLTTTYGDDPYTWRLLQAHYWVFTARESWSLLDAEEEDPLRQLRLMVAEEALPGGWSAETAIRRCAEYARLVKALLD